MVGELLTEQYFSQLGERIWYFVGTASVIVDEAVHYLNGVIEREDLTFLIDVLVVFVLDEVYGYVEDFGGLLVVEGGAMGGFMVAVGVEECC